MAGKEQGATISIDIEIGGPLTVSVEKPDAKRVHTLGQVDELDPVNDRIILRGGRVVNLSRLDAIKTHMNARVTSGIKSLDIQANAIDPLTGLPRSSSEE